MSAHVVGAERATDALLRAGSEDVFAKELLDSLGTVPPYFLRLGEINCRGPSLVEGDGLQQLSAEKVARLGAEVVDVRPARDFAAGHVPGSVSIPLRPPFATWLGWLVDADRLLAVVRNPDQDPAEIVWQARKIGYDRIVGELTGGVTSWSGIGEPASSIPVVDAAGVEVDRVLDIRQAGEYAEGHLRGAAHVELGDLTAAVPALAPGPTVVMCGHGERAMGAASLPERAGRRDVAVLQGGPEDWAETTGRCLETGR
jgi:hydroxyacylglutathione hydrolase